jgi:hypothetical protein
VKELTDGVIPIGLKVWISDSSVLHSELSCIASTPKSRTQSVLTPKPSLRNPSYRICTHIPREPLAHNREHLQRCTCLQ